jgi:F-type H+-transporting ATPase subunit a
MQIADLAEHAGKHVADSDRFEFPLGVEVSLPRVLGFQVTKFMALELVAAALMLAVFLTLAKRMRSGTPPKGPFWNFFEVLLVFIRDEVARPAIGKHDADKFTPFLWNLFFFLLFCNLLGILPWAGSAMSSIMVTAAMAGIAFCTVVGVGVINYGMAGFFKNLVPHMDLDLPKPVAMLLVVVIFFIELASLLIRHVVLAIRLMANMFAGHLVLAVFVGFVAVAANAFLVAQLGISAVSIAASAALTLLELFAAFLQAYIFTFLSALFIGMAAHPH